MKIVTLNLNGLRSALEKGLADWVAQTNADLYAFQEIKVDRSIATKFAEHFPGYTWYTNPAERKGYSGTAILSKIEPQNISYGCGDSRFDTEGRVLCLHFPQFSLMNLYLPSGSSGDERQAFKEEMMAYFHAYIQQQLSILPGLVLVGDFNICHQPIDIHNPVRLKNTSGFLPHERQWFSDFLALGLVDSFRVKNAEPGQYTWWSYRANSKAKNLGWRIDYQLLSSNLIPAIENHLIAAEQNFSDHCPTILTLSI